MLTVTEIITESHNWLKCTDQLIKKYLTIDPSINTSPVPKSQKASQKIEQEEPEDQEDCCENLYSKNDTEMIDIHISQHYGCINKCEKVQNQ